MDPMLQTKIEEYKKLNWSSLLRKDLGEYSLEVAKPTYDRIKKVFDDILTFPSLFDLPTNYQNRVRNQLNNFIEFAERVRTSFQNTAERTTWIQSIRDIEESVWNELYPVYDYIRLIDPSQASHFEKYAKEAQDRVAILDEKLKTTDDLLAGAQKKATEAEVFKYGSYFKDEADQNNKVANRNRWYMFGAMFLTAGLAILMFFLTLNSSTQSQINNLTDFLAYITNKSVLLDFAILSLGGFLVAHFSRTYYAEKNLYTFNKQRQNALDSHRQILNSVQATNSENDKEVSNAILLELTKAIFDSKESGYLKNTSDGSGSTQIVDVSRFLSGK